MKKERCSICGQVTMKHRHVFNAGLAQAFLKAADKFALGQSFHLQHDLELTKSEYANFQKLRYWGLIDKAYATGKRKGGYWTLTQYAEKFIQGECAVVKWVYTFNNKAVDWSEEKVFLKSVIGGFEIPQAWAKRAEPVRFSNQKQMSFV